MECFSPKCWQCHWWCFRGCFCGSAQCTPSSGGSLTFALCATASRGWFWPFTDSTGRCCRARASPIARTGIRTRFCRIWKCKMATFGSTWAFWLLTFSYCACWRLFSCETEFLVRDSKHIFWYSLINKLMLLYSQLKLYYLPHSNIFKVKI